jgi:hypothetical protein
LQHSSTSWKKPRPWARRETWAPIPRRCARETTSRCPEHRRWRCPIRRSGRAISGRRTPDTLPECLAVTPARPRALPRRPRDPAPTIDVLTLGATHRSLRTVSRFGSSPKTNGGYPCIASYQWPAPRESLFG